MRIVTLAEAQADLQNIANQVGSSRFIKAKGLYLDKVMVTAEDGKPMSAEDLEVHVAPKAMQEEEEEMKTMEEDEDKEDKMEEEEEEEKRTYKGLSHRKARQKAFAAPMVGKGRNHYSGRVKNFKDNHNGDAVDKALAFGHWLNAQMGHRKSLAFCERNDLHLKAHTEGVNSAGGFLVPEVFETELISLREEFGVARANCRIRPMTTDVHRIPRRSATLTPYFVGEASAITESTQTFEQVSLVAKKLACITTISSELDEDAFLNISDDVAGEIAYAFAKREDECLFLGDGTSTYGGIVGLADSMGTAGSVDTTELNTTVGDVASADAIADLTKLMALLPQYADNARTAWYMHKSVFHAYAERASRLQGGNDFQQTLGGKYVPTLFGYPVHFSQVLPNSTDHTDEKKLLYFGDLSLAASFGDRRSTTIQVSEHATINSGNVFEQDEIAIRGTERFDINCHDTGDGNDAGPIVALLIKDES